MSLSHIRQLVEKGADASYRDQYGVTLIHVAARNGYVHILRYLIEKGGDINSKVGDNFADGWFAGFTALMIAINDHSVDCAGELCQQPGLDINARTSRKEVDWPDFTALHLAAFGNDREGIEVMLKSPSIDIDATTNDPDCLGMTATHLAAENRVQGHEDCLRPLIEHGASTNIMDGNCRYPIQYAIENNNFDSVKQLLDNTITLRKNRFSEQCYHLQEDCLYSDSVFLSAHV